MQKPQEMWIWSLGWEAPPEKGMATHSSTLAWRIPGTEEPGGLQSTGSQRVRHDWSDVAHTQELASGQRSGMMEHPLWWWVTPTVTGKSSSWAALAGAELLLSVSGPAGCSCQDLWRWLLRWLCGVSLHQLRLLFWLLAFYPRLFSRPDSLAFPIIL